jgi:hypothetical protein
MTNSISETLQKGGIPVGGMECAKGYENRASDSGKELTMIMERSRVTAQSS